VFLTALRERVHSVIAIPPGRKCLLLMPMEIILRFWLQDITNWCRQQEETQSKYANLSNGGHHIFSNIAHGVGVEASISLGQDSISWGQSQTTGDMFRVTVVVRQIAQANNGITIGENTAWNSTETENDFESKTVVGQRTLHRMAKNHDILERSQGRRNLCPTRQESHAHLK